VTPTPIRRPSPSRSNLGSGGHLATTRSTLTLVVTRSMYHEPTTKAHDTPSVAADYGRRSIRSVVFHAAHKLPRFQMSASSRRSGSASLPTIRAPPGGPSWWFRRTNHHGSARWTLRRHVGSRATPTAPRGRRRSSARRCLRAPATYISSSKRWGCQCSTALRPTWVRLWHVSSRPTPLPRLMRPWLTVETS
jgi:hypothetical protein